MILRIQQTGRLIPDLVDSVLEDRRENGPHSGGQIAPISRISTIIPSAGNTIGYPTGAFASVRPSSPVSIPAAHAGSGSNGSGSDPGVRSLVARRTSKRPNATPTATPPALHELPSSPELRSPPSSGPSAVSSAVQTRLSRGRDHRRSPVDRPHRCHRDRSTADQCHPQSHEAVRGELERVRPRHPLVPLACLDQTASNAGRTNACETSVRVSTVRFNDHARRAEEASWLRWMT